MLILVRFSYMKKLFLVFFIALFFVFLPKETFAQRLPVTTPVIDTSITPEATDEATVASESANTAKEDVTKPEEPEEKEEVLQLFSKRPAPEPTLFNFMEYYVQYAVRNGVPANTIILILLLPLLATIVAFIRHIVGLPSIGMLVPIALSITLLATGITAGMILLATIVFASTLARILLKKVRIMLLPKMAISILFVALFVFITLTIGASLKAITVEQLSIFPVLLLIILSERIVALQLERNAKEMITIIVVTLCLGIIGFFILSFVPLREFVLLYPESILLLIPINFIIGRYFGLRLTEYSRFSQIQQHGSK